jgi:hypothetical protein
MIQLIVSATSPDFSPGSHNMQVSQPQIQSESLERSVRPTDHQK